MVRGIGRIAAVHNVIESADFDHGSELASSRVCLSGLGCPWRSAERVRLARGWGDIAIGATASFVALKRASPDHRKIFVLWQVLGIADLVTAVTLGKLARVIDPHGIPTNAMTVLPLSLIPTFAVPLLLILHVICIVQAIRWPVRQRSTMGEHLHSPAA